jgi:hypothetical protein
MASYDSSVTTTTYERWFIDSVERYNDLGQSQEIAQTYIVRRKDHTVLNYNGDDLNLMVVEGIIPAVGDLYVAWDPASAKGMWQPLARCRSMEFQTIDTTGNRVRVNILWSCMAATDPKTIHYLGSNPYDPTKNVNYLPASLEYQASLRAMKVWKTGWTTQPPTVAGTSPYAPVNETSADIGGTTVKDIANGLEVQVPQTRVRLRFIRDSSVTKMEDQWTVVKDYIGRIHAPTSTGTGAKFFNFDPGTIYCEGVSMVKLDHEYYEVIFDFLWDAYSHHEQVVDVEAWGDPKLQGNTLNLERVDWRRIPRTAVDFNNIFSTEPELKKIVARGYWEP